jgi:hypothetical protein
MTTPGFPVCGKSGLKNSVIVTLKNVKTASSEESGLRFFMENQSDTFVY